MCPRRPSALLVLQLCSPFPHPFVSLCLNLCHLSFFFYLFSTDVIFSHHLGSHQGWRSPLPPSLPSSLPSRHHASYMSYSRRCTLITYSVASISVPSWILCHYAISRCMQRVVCLTRLHLAPMLHRRSLLHST